jgi:hypothetical protein
MPSAAAVELAFPHDYLVEVLAAAPPSGLVELGAPSRVRIPDSGEDVDALHVKVTPPEGESWIGSFARGFESDGLSHGVWAWPDGVSLAVVSAGYGYVVKAREPKSWVRLQPMPITDVRVIADHQLIVFADFTNIYAYNAEKNVWKSDRLSWDGVTITQVATNHIFGLGWDAMADKEIEFVIDVRTGQHTGGAQPWAKR